MSQIYVIAGNFGRLPSYQTALALGLIKVNANHIHSEHTTHEQLTKAYALVFDRVATVEDHEVKLHIDERVTSVAQNPRRIHFTSARRSQIHLRSWSAMVSLKGGGFYTLF